MELNVSIKKNLRDFVLAVDFTTRDEVFALLGASGCGKSMTLKCIAGIETPDSGRIILNGRTLFDSVQKINLPPQARRVGYLFQNYALFPNMTVAENIMFVATGTDAEKHCKLAENLARFKLDGLGNSYPHELSGGQQQRVAFARILASHAEILLLDEPFSALDGYLKWQLELELLEVLKSYSGAAILVSHDRGEVFRLANRIAVMNRGRVEALNTKHELFSNPQTVAATLLTGCKNISAARKIDDSTIFAEDWRLTLTARNIPAALKFVAIRAQSPVRGLGFRENVFDMEIAQIVEDTASFIVMLRAKGTDAKLLRWEVDKHLWRRLNVKECRVHFPTDKIILLTG